MQVRGSLHNAHWLQLSLFCTAHFLKTTSHKWCQMHNCQQSILTFRALTAQNHSIVALGRRCIWLGNQIWMMSHAMLWAMSVHALLVRFVADLLLMFAWQMHQSAERDEQGEIMHLLSWFKLTLATASSWHDFLLSKLKVATSWCDLLWSRSCILPTCWMGQPVVAVFLTQMNAKPMTNGPWGSRQRKMWMSDSNLSFVCPWFHKFMQHIAPMVVSILFCPATAQTSTEQSQIMSFLFCFLPGWQFNKF